MSTNSPIATNHISIATNLDKFMTQGYMNHFNRLESDQYATWGNLDIFW
jgi:hypothetical protein